MNGTNPEIVDQISTLFHTLGVGWVLWLLIILSVGSIAIMIERAIFFSRRTLGKVDQLLPMLRDGDLAGAGKLVGDQPGLEAEVVRQGLKIADRGPEAVEEMIEAVVASERLHYERFLSFLGTLGNNAPFIGLFGTVLGIVEAFAALAITAKTGSVTHQSADIMRGISEALIATAIGLLVALPSVVVYNAFGRWLTTIVGRSQALGHALSSHLKSAPGRDEAASPVTRP
jgi:biopolymer transport protein ExbB/TolQ